MAATAVLDTVAVDANGATHAATISMDSSWAVEAFLKDETSSLGPLALACAFPWGGDAIYLFSSLARDRPPLETSPPPVAELLLFPPVVPLRWQPGGFQAISAAEWEALVITELVNRPATCASAPLRLPSEGPTWEEDGTSEEDNSMEETSSEEELLGGAPAEEDEEDGAASAASYGAASGSD
jgi:hypothetical protein